MAILQKMQLKMQRLYSSFSNFRKEKRKLFTDWARNTVVIFYYYKIHNL